MEHYNQPEGESRYVHVPDPRFPVTFREAPFYNDVYYPPDFRDQHPIDPGYGGPLIPCNGQFFLDPWNYGYPRYYIVEHQYPGEAVESTVKLYAPQLCCDICEDRVVEAFEDFPDVRKVVADQWEKKVVVVGENLQPEQVLRRLQRVPHMDRSVFWKDR